MIRLLTSIGFCAGVLLSAPGAFAAGNMKTGAMTSQPIGHYEFCRLYRDECMVRSRETAPLTLDRETWAAVLNINSRINLVVRPESDLDIYGKEEVWTYPDQAGDCEDYVLLKRRLLIDAGLPESTLLITVVRKPDGEGHAVLTLRTSEGDFILDNLTSKVMLWKDTDYTYLKRQSARHTGHWVSIEMPDQTIVGSVK